MRAVDLHSRRLAEEHGLTGPQLATLQVVRIEGPCSPATIARCVHLSRATVTGILARLERRGLVLRRPSESDRRSVLMHLTPLGEQVLERAPSLLQDRFRERLSRLEEWEQLSVLASLQRIASMMDASGLDASPHLVTGSEDIQSDPGGAPPSADPSAAEPPASEPTP